RKIEKLHRGIRAAHSALKVGEICFRHFSVTALRCSYPDIFHGVCARDCGTTAVGWRRVLVLLVRRRTLVNRFLRSAATNSDLRLRTRAYACAVGLAHGRSREQVPGWSRRWAC